MKSFSRVNLLINNRFVMSMTKVIDLTTHVILFCKGKIYLYSPSVI